MFWTDWGQSPKLERSALNGTKRVTMVTSNLRWPFGIDLDRRNQVVLWVDAGMSRVESVDYHGNNRKLLYQRAGRYYFGVTFFSSYLYVSEWLNNAIYRINASHAGNITREAYFLNSGTVNGLVAYDSSRQTTG